MIGDGKADENGERRGEEKSSGLRHIRKETEWYIRLFHSARRGITSVDRRLHLMVARSVVWKT